MLSGRTGVAPEPVLVPASSSCRVEYRQLIAPDGRVEEYKYLLTPTKEDSKQRKRRRDANRRSNERAASRLDTCKHMLAREEDNARQLRRRIDKAHGAGKSHVFRPVDPWSGEELATLSELVLELMPEMMSHDEAVTRLARQFRCRTCQRIFASSLEAQYHRDESRHVNIEGLLWHEYLWDEHAATMYDEPRLTYAYEVKESTWQDIAEHLFAWHGIVRSALAVRLKYYGSSENRPLWIWTRIEKNANANRLEDEPLGDVECVTE